MCLGRVRNASTGGKAVRRYGGGYPLFSLPLPDELAPGPCPVASRVCEFIEGYLREGGYTETELADMLPEATLLPDHDLALAPS